MTSAIRTHALVKRYRRLTPLCKYMCSERAIVITRNMGPIDTFIRL